MAEENKDEDMSRESVQHQADAINAVKQEFKPIGPTGVMSSRKKKYKFIEPPGIFSWLYSFAKKCLVVGVVYSMGYFQVNKIVCIYVFIVIT